MVIPGSVPASMLACLCHVRKVSGPMLRRVPISRQVRVDACLGVVFEAVGEVAGGLWF